MIFYYIKCKNCCKIFDNIYISKFSTIETPYGDAKRIDIISMKFLTINNNQIKCKICNSNVGFTNETHKIFLNSKCIFF